MKGSLSWIVFFALLFILATLLYFIIKKRRKSNIIEFCILLLYFIYSFFTTSGSVRLAISLMGHPISAYTTNFKHTSRDGTKNKYVLPLKQITIQGGYMEYFECKTYYGII